MLKNNYRMIIFVIFACYVQRGVNRAVLGNMVAISLLPLFSVPSPHWDASSFSLEALFSPHFLHSTSLRYLLGQRPTSEDLIRAQWVTLHPFSSAFLLEAHHYLTNRRELFIDNLLQRRKEITLKIKRPEFINTSLWLLCVKCWRSKTKYSAKTVPAH